MNIVRNNPDNNEIQLFLAYCMSALSFPSGFILVGLIGFMFQFLDFLKIKINLPHNNFIKYIEIIFYWFLFFIPGYFQWFKLIPYFYSKFRTLIRGHHTN